MRLSEGHREHHEQVILLGGSVKRREPSSCLALPESTRFGVVNQVERWII